MNPTITSQEILANIRKKNRGRNANTASMVLDTVMNLTAVNCNSFPNLTDITDIS